MTKSRPEPSLGPQASTELISRTHLLGRNDMSPELSFDVLRVYCTPRIVLYQETLPKWYCALSMLTMNCLASDSLKSDPGSWNQSSLSFHPHLSAVHFSAHHKRCQGPSQQNNFGFKQVNSRPCPGTEKPWEGIDFGKKGKNPCWAMITFVLKGFISYSDGVST